VSNLLYDTSKLQISRLVVRDEVGEFISDASLSCHVQHLTGDKTFAKFLTLCGLDHGN
jgi:hypothetical protein